MATALTMVTDALKEIGVVGEGEVPSATMSDDAFRALNRIVEMMANESAFSYFASSLSRALTGESSFTIGPTGQVVGTRPIKIETATVDRGGITYPVQVVDNQQYDSIIQKAATGSNPIAIFYDARMANGIVRVWPVSTGCTLNMRVLDADTTFASLGSTVSLPPGYEEYLIKALAVNIAPQYPASKLNQLTVVARNAAWKRIDNVNNIVPTMSIDSALQNSRGGSLAAFNGGY